MKTSARCFLSVSLLVAGSVALSGCGRSSSKATNISYRPLGICRGYETAAGPVTAGPNKGFAVFKIETVDNTKDDDSFIFAPARLFVNQSPPVLALGSANRRFVHPDSRFDQTMGLKSASETTLAAGEKRAFGSIVLIPLNIADPSGGAEANKFSFELAYDTGEGEKGEQQNVNDGIVFTITSPADAKWSVVENCKDLALK
jgi:hypothetical protein